jgi:2,3-bisphosphoglycerate-independent phosphoglycerate mutase
MRDFTAGHIGQREADRLITDLRGLSARHQVKFHAGVSYRNLMVLEHAAEVNCVCTPPHDIPDAQVEPHQPRGPGAERIRRVMDEAHALLAMHEVNQRRRERGQPAATDIWLWGQGRQKPLDSLHSRFGVRGACIAAVDLIKGIAIGAGLTVIPVAGATGYLDTNYRAKGQAAVAALDRYDVIVVHVEAPDEAGHLGDAAEKVKAIEKVDQAVVGPLLEKLRSFDAWRIAVVPDHPTPVGTRTHSSAPPPFCCAGTGVAATGSKVFSEAQAAQLGMQFDPGHHFMTWFLAR